MSEVSPTDAPPVPRQAALNLVAAINASDLGAATASFARDGTLLTPDGTAVRGREDIASILAQMIAAGTQIEVESHSLLRGGRVAVASECWRISSGVAVAPPLAQRTQAMIVAELIENEWKLVIAAPWGWGFPPRMAL